MAGEPGAGLLRVSTSEQDEQIQKADIQAFANANGIDLGGRWYELHGKSASKGEQDEAFDGILADIRQGTYTRLITCALDRTERRGIEPQLRIIRLIREAGGQLMSVYEPWLNDPDADAELHIALTAKMNKAKSELQARNTRRGHDTVDANGAFRGRIPWGFITEGTRHNMRLVPTPDGREYVPQIFARIVDGESLRQVCDWLNTLNVRFKRSGEPAPWWPEKVAEMIRNPAYLGYYWIHTYETVRDDNTGQVVSKTLTGKRAHRCEALVDARTFSLAGEALASRERKQQGPRGKPENRAMLKGAITCPACGSPMYKIVSRLTSRTDGPKAPFYRCNGRPPLTKGCGNCVPMDAVDDAVSTIIAEWFAVPVVLPTLVKGTDYTAQIDEIKYQMRELDPDVMDDDEYDAELARLRAERNRLKALSAMPDRWEMTETGELYSDVYAGLSVALRGAWLKAHGFGVQASREAVTVTKGNLGATVELR